MLQLILSFIVNTLFTNLSLYRTFVLLSIIFCKFLAVSPEIVPAPESHRSVASLSSSQTPYQSFPCKHEKLFHFVAPPLPKKQMLFGDPTVFAKSYHFQTVIKFSRCIKAKKVLTSDEQRKGLLSLVSRKTNKKTPQK